MYLKKIHITNFRCFKDYTIEFAPGVTVLFGKNGTGKSTLIHAVHKAMSFMMYSYNVTETVKVKDKKKKKVVGVKTITNNNPYLHPKGFKNDDFNNHGDAFIEVGAIANFSDSFRDLDWKMSVKANNNRLRTTEFEEAFLSFYNWHQETNELPLLAYFSDCFPHREDNKKKRIKSKIASLRNFGYFDWDEEEGCTKEWIERLERTIRNCDRIERKFRMINNALRDFGTENISSEDSFPLDKQMLRSYKNEISAIETCLVKFSSQLGIENSIYKVLSLALHPDDDKLCIVTPDENNRYVSFRKLPAGYKRLLNITLDLAYRSFILSEGKSCDIKGLAIIDEIDLHLHPELEQVVLARFMATFPNLQFIVSTHSPLVLTDLETKEKKNVVLRMEPDTIGPEVLHDIHGIDYNLMLEENMGVQKRKPSIQALFDRAWQSVSDKDITGAKAIVQELEEKTPSDQSELIKLRSMIKRLELIGR